MKNDSEPAPERHFNKAFPFPYGMSWATFKKAIDDVMSSVYEIDKYLLSKKIPSLAATMGPATYSGFLSDMFTRSIVKFAPKLAVNQYHNGHPDLIVKGRYDADSAKAGTDGIEIKVTRNIGGNVDTHGARNEWMCVFVYSVKEGQKILLPTTQIEKVFLALVAEEDFRVNERGPRGTRTASLHKEGIVKLRTRWVFDRTFSGDR